MELSPEHQLNDSRKIKWLLKSLKNQHQLITLSLADSELKERTMIVEVCVDKSYLLLDSAIDPKIDQLVKKGKPFSLDTSYDGVDVRAEAVKVVETLKDSKGDLYKVLFPEKIYYIQRRDAFRVSPPGLKSMPMVIGCDDEDVGSRLASSETFLSNISVQGCLVSFSDKTGLLFDDDELMATLEFKYPETNELLLVSAHMCHKRFLERSQIWLVGFEFCDMSGEIGGLIEKLVLKLQLAARQRNNFD